MSSRRPDPLKMSGFLSGKLPPDERASIAADLDADPDSYEMATDILAVLGDHPETSLAEAEADDKDASVLRFPRRSFFLGGGFLAAAAVVLFWFAAPMSISELENETELALNVLAEKNVPLLRFHLGFDIEQQTDALRSDGNSEFNDSRFDQIITKLEKAKENDQVRKRLIALLILAGDQSGAYLEAQNFDSEDVEALCLEIVATFLQAVKKNNEAAQIQQINAMKALNQSHPRNKMIIYNLASMLETMGEREQALPWWEAFTVLDSSTLFAKEARMRFRN